MKKFSKYFLYKILKLIPVLLIIITASFFLMRAAPGGPFDLEKALSADAQESLNKLWGLDKPLVAQYFIYLGNLFKGNMGTSFTYMNSPVVEIIFNSFKISFVLGFFAFLFALITGIPLGIASALSKNKVAKFFFFSFTLFGISIPSIILAPLLIIIFGVWLKIFPVAGLDSFRSFILPILALSSVYISYVARITRAGFIENKNKDYVKSAMSMGVSRSKIIFKYVLRESMLPLISYIGPAFAGIITGSLVIEKIFGINGLGSHFVNSALNRDYPLALGVVIFYSALLLLINLISDLIYVLIDPRITYKKEGV